MPQPKQKGSIRDLSEILAQPQKEKPHLRRSSFTTGEYKSEKGVKNGT